MIVALTAFLISSIKNRYWRPFPIFFLYCVIALIFHLLYDIMSLPPTIWVNWEVLKVGTRIACGAEIMIALTIGMRMWERILSIGSSVLFPWMMISISVHLTESSPVDSLIHRVSATSSHIEGIIAISTLMIIVLEWVIGLDYSIINRRHALLFSALMINQTIGLELFGMMKYPVDTVKWQYILRWSYAIGIACLIGFISNSRLYLFSLRAKQYDVWNLQLLDEHHQDSDS